ncbi:hypothetical protein PHISCL_05337 [Aspergillus sclerotialis]|uniref:Uncharacterized protein n=1 Tax=Aspergillus sclerotialis TaxID=2070753 RepID=A0A3A2ZGK4_9EURO|nr:hypothetical protein PHISCL_05337 [Aspergillus sclerotialis]
MGAFSNVGLIFTFCLSAFKATIATSYSFDYAAEVDFLVRQGPRLTGSPAHNTLIDRIEGNLTSLGLEVKSDNYTFHYMAPASTSKALSLVVDGRHMEIASVFPYSGRTNDLGTTGQLINVPGPHPNWKLAKGNIAVVSISNPSLPYSMALGTWDPSKRWAGNATNPLIPSDMIGETLTGAKKAGVKAVIFAWDETITPEKSHNQYLPFKFPYADIPAVFTSGETSKDILAAAKSKSSATLTLNSELIPNTQTRTIYAVVEGSGPKKSHETLLIVTHTDGTNVIEENGHIGVLQLAHDIATVRPERTHIFVFTTGHLRIPAFTKSGKATTRWLNDHPEFWKGGNGQRRAIAGLTIEHLGAVEFQENLSTYSYSPTGKVQPEMLYASTKDLAAITQREWRGADPSFTRVSKPANMSQFGEGAALSDKEIPNISLATGPCYLLSKWDGDEHDLIDMPALTRQVRSFQALRKQLDAM